MASEVKKQLFSEGVTVTTPTGLSIPTFVEDTVVLVNSGPENLNGTIKITQLGDQITLTATITHDSDSTPESDVGVIAAQFRPVVTVRNVYSLVAAGLLRVQLEAGGRISFEYRSYAGALITRTTSEEFSLVYHL